MKMSDAFLQAFGGDRKKEGFEKITLFRMKDKSTRRVEKAEGWARVVGLGGKILFEGFAFSTKINRVYGRDGHITVLVKPYDKNGHSSVCDLGRAESVLFLGLGRSEIERMMSKGEKPDGV